MPFTPGSGPRMLCPTHEFHLGPWSEVFLGCTLQSPGAQGTKRHIAWALGERGCAAQSSEGSFSPPIGTERPQLSTRDREGLGSCYAPGHGYNFFETSGLDLLKLSGLSESLSFVRNLKYPIGLPFPPCNLAILLLSQPLIGTPMAIRLGE